MAGNEEFPTGFGDPNGRKARTFQRDDLGRGPADNDYDLGGNESLDLESGPSRLPWLEADDDDYQLETADSGRILGFALLGLVALASIIGGIWWATNRKADTTFVADGSTIPAPEAPYKVLPSDAGGKTFDGTGDSAFAVSEGENRPVRLGEASASPAPVAAPSAAPTPAAPALAKPAVDLAAKPVATPSLAAARPVVPAPAVRATPVVRKPAAPAPAVAAASGGPVVQVGAYSTRALAEAAWKRLSSRTDALSGQRYQIVEGRADIGTVHRLQVIAGNSGAANALCGKLKSAGLACQVK